MRPSHLCTPLRRQGAMSGHCEAMMDDVFLPFFLPTPKKMDWELGRSQHSPMYPANPATQQLKVAASTTQPL